MSEGSCLLVNCSCGTGEAKERFVVGGSLSAQNQEMTTCVPSLREGEKIVQCPEAVEWGEPDGVRVGGDEGLRERCGVGLG